MILDGKPHILITGASGAIGSALATYYAGQGCELTLLGRNLQLLKLFKKKCENLGVNVEVYSMELTDFDTLQIWLDSYLEKQLPDIFIANAGMNINNGKKNNGEGWDEMNQLLDLNIKSTMMITNRIGKAMKQRGSGQIALISSLAGYYGLPITPSYSASKAAVKAYGEGIRGWLAPFGVGVTVVMPGYVQSDMCDGMKGPKPFLWQPEKAARVIAKGIEKNKARVSFPFPLNLGSWFLAALPSSLSQYFLRLLNYSSK